MSGRLKQLHYRTAPATATTRARLACKSAMVKGQHDATSDPCEVTCKRCLAYLASLAPAA